MNKLILVLPTILLMMACGDDDVHGGHCDYVIDTVGATIVRMDSTGTPYPDIVLHVTRANGDLDSIRYTNNTGENPIWDTCIARGYKAGVKLKTEHHLRTSGHCDPEYFVVTKDILK